MTRQIVVAFRMPPAGMSPGPEGAYLTRARSLCARGEALGGRLVAWSASQLVMSWDTDSIEEALLLAVSIREESLASERAWSSGIAEGELEPLAPDGARMHLAWGEALLAATSLSRVARPGEACVDGDLRALRAGQLNVLGSASASDGGLRVRGWRLDLEHPWKQAPDAIADEEAEAARSSSAASLEAADAAATLEMPVIDLSGASRALGEVTFTTEELSSAEVLDLVEPATLPPEPPSRAASPSQPPSRAIADRLRELARDDGAGALEALAELRRAKARSEGGPPAARCQAAVGLAMTLAIAGRYEEALLEAMDGLARARDMQDARAIGACTALLAKIYAGAGQTSEAQALLAGS